VSHSVYGIFPSFRWKILREKPDIISRFLSHNKIVNSTRIRYFSKICHFEILYAIWKKVSTTHCRQCKRVALYSLYTRAHACEYILCDIERRSPANFYGNPKKISIIFSEISDLFLKIRLLHHSVIVHAMSYSRELRSLSLSELILFHHHRYLLSRTTSDRDIRKTKRRVTKT